MTKEELDRATRLLESWKTSAIAIGAGHTEIAWVAAILAGDAIGQGSGDNPEAFAKNVAKVDRTVHGQAERSFGCME